MFKFEILDKSNLLIHNLLMKKLRPLKRNLSEKLKSAKAKAKFLEKGIEPATTSKGLFSPHTIIRDNEI